MLKMINNVNEYLELLEGEAIAYIILGAKSKCKNGTLDFYLSNLWSQDN